MLSFAVVHWTTFRDADSASCRVAELVSQELLQLLLTIDSIILSLNLVCSFFLSLCLSVFLSVCLSFSHCSSYFLSFSCFHKIIFPFTFILLSFLFYPFNCLPFPRLPHLPQFGSCLPRSIAICYHESASLRSFLDLMSCLELAVKS